MSGHSDSTECPNCGADAELYTNYKPFEYCSINCYECGLTIYPIVRYMNLKQLNAERTERELPKLKKKPKQDLDI